MAARVIAGHEDARASLIACCDASPALEPREGIFYPVSLFVGDFVIRMGPLSCRGGRDAGLGAAAGEFAQLLRHGPSGDQMQCHRCAVLVVGGMQLAGQPVAGAANGTLRPLPTVSLYLITLSYSLAAAILYHI